MSGWGFCCALVRKRAVAYTCPAVNTDVDKTYLRLSRSTRKKEENTYTPYQGQNEKRAVIVVRLSLGGRSGNPLPVVQRTNALTE